MNVLDQMNIIESRSIKLPLAICEVSLEDLNEKEEDQELNGEFSEKTKLILKYIEKVDNSLTPKVIVDEQVIKKDENIKSVNKEESEEQREDDKSAIVEETSFYIKIDDPKNYMQIILYKYRETSNNLSEEYVPSIMIENPLHYHKRVQTWFDDSQKALRENGYLARGKRQCLEHEHPYKIQIHNFSKVVDSKLCEFGLQTIFTDHKGQQVKNISIPASIIYKDEVLGVEKNEYGYLTYAFLDDGTCYHRCFSTR